MRIYRGMKIRYSRTIPKIHGMGSQEFRIYLQKGLIPMYNCSDDPHYFERNESHVLI